MATIVLSALNVYPVKSCRGIALERATLTAAGLEHDREWMVVRPDGRFVTQREAPQLALVGTALERDGLRLQVPGAPVIPIPFDATGTPVTVNVWNHRAAAFDMGDEAASALSAHLRAPHRLVRFDPAHRRLSNREWTRGLEVPNRFSDGFPLLAIGNASLADLNSRLQAPLTMDRFRPNLVLDGLLPYAEDALDELSFGPVRLKVAKPCTRCVITTTDQSTGRVSGNEPLATLRGYRRSSRPQGVVFGQNVIVIAGAGEELATGQSLAVTWRAGAAVDPG